ncbi:MAG TPA: MFS transporter [Rhizomicrobium sp.]
MSQDLSAREAAEAAQPDGAVLVGEGVHTPISDTYRSYILVVMTLVYVINYLDRQIFGILVPGIKAEFNLSDTQIGVLAGPAFAIVYATLGIPLAMVADRANRRNIIALALTIFSVMTVFCGRAMSFGQLALARFGTGIGEAGTGPSINSILADLYPPEKRASALAFYSAGLNVGLLVAFVSGGWLMQHYGWRNAFLAAGIPGIFVAILVLLTVREPQRGLVEKLKDPKATPDILTVAAYLWSQRSFRWMAIGTSFSSFGGYAGIAFVPQFLMKSHHLTPTEVGFFLAFLTGIFGAIGTYMSGFFADKYGARDVRANLYVPIVATFISVIFVPIYFLTPAEGTPFILKFLPAVVNVHLPWGSVFTAGAGTVVVLASAAGPSLLGASFVGPAYSLAQGLVPLRMRAQSIAILLFVLNILGLSFGPLVTGMVADALKPAFGADSLRYALMTGIVTGLIGAFCYWRATKTLKADLARVER